jgi:hypothetical protein
MPRPYSDKFLRELEASGDKGLGVVLARACIRANLPATYVAVALETSRITIYGWFRGKQIRAKKEKTIETFIELLENDMREGRLPAKSPADAKSYIQDMIGAQF